MKKLDLLSKIRTIPYILRTRFLSNLSNGDQVHGVLVVYICREFHGELVCDQTESKELRFFPLDELPGTLHPVIGDSSRFSSLQLKIKIKRPHLICSCSFNTGYPASLNVFVNSFTFSLLPTESNMCISYCFCL